MYGVRSISVAGFRSIRDLNFFTLDRLNVLIGANGAGKSNFLELFSFLRKVCEQRLQTYVQSHGGPDAIVHLGGDISEKLHV
jgi:predicted ATPase